MSKCWFCGYKLTPSTIGANSRFTDGKGRTHRCHTSCLTQHEQSRRRTHELCTQKGEGHAATSQ